MTSRNTPSVINAVFNLRNFWDGRANNTFNAATPFGDADARAGVLVAVGGTLGHELVRLNASSLASQAVGPPLNAIEMSFDGRTWPHLGRKMLSLTPLARQTVAGDDSVLGPFANLGGTGLRPDVSYGALIRASFQAAYWSSPAVVDADGRVIVAIGEPTGTREFSQMAYNFGLFFGLAVQAYESTLVSDDTPVDLFLAGDASALTDLQQQGLNEFRSGGSQCTQCHQGPELSAAGVTTASRANSLDPRDVGFFRTGVSAIEDDPGAAGVDGSGAPLFPAAPGSRASGAFKSPGLRNVELTGPYFHTGGAATLEQVLEFYARNGDVPDGGNLGPGMGSIRLNQQERGQIVEFLKALTDDRVDSSARRSIIRRSACRSATPRTRQACRDRMRRIVAPALQTPGAWFRRWASAVTRRRFRPSPSCWQVSAAMEPAPTHSITRVRPSSTFRVIRHIVPYHPVACHPRPEVLASPHSPQLRNAADRDCRLLKMPSESRSRIWREKCQRRGVSAIESR